MFDNFERTFVADLKGWNIPFLKHTGIALTQSGISKHFWYFGRWRILLQQPIFLFRWSADAKQTNVTIEKRVRKHFWKLREGIAGGWSHFSFIIYWGTIFYDVGLTKYVKCESSLLVNFSTLWKLSCDFFFSIQSSWSRLTFTKIE